MQRLSGAATAVYFDPVQRAEQWKQVVSKEEKHLGLSARSRIERPPQAPKRGVDGSAVRNAGAGSGMSARRELRSSRGSLRSGRGPAPQVPGLRRNDYAMSTARSSLSYRSSRSRRSGRSMRSSRSGSSLSTGRSGYSLTSSLPSSASGMTTVALQRLEKLEKVCACVRGGRAALPPPPPAPCCGVCLLHCCVIRAYRSLLVVCAPPLPAHLQSLDAERHQRQQAEEQLEQLRRLVDERLMRLEGPGK